MKQQRTFSQASDIVDYLEAVAHTKFDSVIPLSEIQAVVVEDQDKALDENGEFPLTIGLGVPREISPMEKIWGTQEVCNLKATRNAFRNLFGRLNLSKGWAFMRDDASPHAAEEGAALMNALIAKEKFNSGKRGPKNIMVRSRGEIRDIDGIPDTGAVHRALFSDQYVRLDMLPIARIIQQYADQFENMSGTDELMTQMRKQHGANVSIVDDIRGDGGIGHKIVRPEIGIDSMSFRMMLNIRFNTPELGDFYPGVYIGTSEDGTLSTHCLGYIWRQICANGMMGSYERKEITQMRRAAGWAPVIYHRWDDEEGMQLQFHKAATHALAASTDLIKKAQEAAYRNLPNAQDIMSQMLTNIVPKDNLNSALLNAGAGMEGENSVMGLVNGITSVAHDPELSREDVDKLEALGGTALRKYDSEFTDKELTNLFLGLANVELIQSEEATS